MGKRTVSVTTAGPVLDVGVVGVTAVVGWGVVLLGAGCGSVDCMYIFRTEDGKK